VREREIERWEIPGRAGEREREMGHWPGEGNEEGARMAGRFRLEEMVGGDWRAGVGDGEREIVIGEATGRGRERERYIYI
jgi:hypothetical protein